MTMPLYNDDAIAVQSDAALRFQQAPIAKGEIA
jgi:hypothetical protein